jgi:hypothetical protein
MSLPMRSVVAASAIGRTLTAAGATWHDLVEKVTSPASPPPSQQRASSTGARNPRPRYEPTSTWRPNNSDFSDVDVPTLDVARQMHGWLLRTGVGGAWDKSFVASLEQGMREYGRWTDKQMRTLAKVALRCGWTPGS